MVGGMTSVFSLTGPMLWGWMLLRSAVRVPITQSTQTTTALRLSMKIRSGTISTVTAVATMRQIDGAQKEAMGRVGMLNAPTKPL